MAAVARRYCFPPSSAVADKGCHLSLLRLCCTRESLWTVAMRPRSGSLVPPQTWQLEHLKDLLCRGRETCATPIAESHSRAADQTCRSAGFAASAMGTRRIWGTLRKERERRQTCHCSARRHERTSGRAGSWQEIDGLAVARCALGSVSGKAMRYILRLALLTMLFSSSYVPG